MTLGIISATHRNIGDGPYDYLQTDADMNHGSAGGPLFDFNGEVVGMARTIYSPTGHNVGIGFAIPSNIVQKVAGELKKSGSVERGWLGVRIQDIDADIAASLGLKDAKGALIAEVLEEGPAASAGLKLRDVVLAVDGKDIPDARHVQRTIADQKPDTTIDLVIWRDREKKTVPVRLGRFPTRRPTAEPERKAVASKETGTHVSRV